MIDRKYLVMAATTIPAQRLAVKSSTEVPFDVMTRGSLLGTVNRTGELTAGASGFPSSGLSAFYCDRRRPSTPACEHLVARWQPDTRDEVFEARISSQSVERRIRIEVNDPPLPVAKCSFEPVDGFVVLPKTRKR